MIKKIGVFALLVAISSFAYKTNSKTYSLTVNVSDLRNSKGVVQFALYNQDGTIPDEDYVKYFKKLNGKISEKSSTVTFDNLPPGTYAINILHDEDKNGKIDKGFILPKEGIGFSNYSSIGLSKRPKFSKASFELKSDLEMEVKIIYM